MASDCINQRSPFDHDYCCIFETNLLEGLKTVYSPVSCDQIMFYLSCNNLSCVILFVQPGSVEVLVFL